MSGKYHYRYHSDPYKRALKKAHKIGVTIEPARNHRKKLDVFKNGKLKASIGNSSYPDFNWTQNVRQRAAYYANKGNAPKYTVEWYAAKILW